MAMEVDFGGFKVGFAETVSWCVEEGKEGDKTLLGLGLYFLWEW